MVNLELGESSLMKNYEAIKTSEHQRPVEFFKPTTSPDVLYLAYRASTPNLPFATPYPNEPVNTDLSVIAQAEPYKDNGLDPRGGMDLQEWRKLRKRQQNREAARKSKIRKKHEYEDLKDKVRAISHETTLLREDIMRHSEEIASLRTENKALWEELRNGCDQETISRFESMDPESSCQD